MQQFDSPSEDRPPEDPQIEVENGPSGNKPRRGRGRRRRWLYWLAGLTVTFFLALMGAAVLIGRHFEPYIREQAIRYMETRFESKVEIAGLHVRAPRLSLLRLLRETGPELVNVEGEGIVMRHRGRTDVPPMFVLKSFTAVVDLRTLFSENRTVSLVTLDGMEITIPPKSAGPSFTTPKATNSAKAKAKVKQLDLNAEAESDAEDAASRNTGVVIEHVAIEDAVLVILPKKQGKDPLRFDLRHVRLDSVGKDAPMKYRADLTNAKPVGDITSTGTFGPWTAGEPSNTPLAGDYLFEHADLGVFNAIKGTLRSTGSFAGKLGFINARGEATVPDFSLKRTGAPVPLTAAFEVLVDGTNGNTELKPVKATLGSTRFTTSGAVIRYQGDTRRTISLNVSMPKGNLRDLLRLAMKGDPFMEGTLKLDTKVGIPPLSGTVNEKLLLSGTFDISNGKFLKSAIQDQIDSLSRRGQGQPKNQDIDEVISHMSGSFDMANETIQFPTLAFAIPGAAVNISGKYDLDQDFLDFHGSVALDAKVSQTMTGWKHWVLKPADPFFSKNGAGTYLKIQIVGTAKQPKFGLDKAKPGDGASSQTTGKSAIRKMENTNRDPTRNSLRKHEQ